MPITSPGPFFGVPTQTFMTPKGRRKYINSPFLVSLIVMKRVAERIQHLLITLPLALCISFIIYTSGKKEHICYLQDLFVDERFRKRGIAENLINEVYTEADQRKAKGVYWLTQDFNVKARGLYDKIATQTSFIKYMRS